MIERWAKITKPKDLLAAMDEAEKAHGWKAPDALLVRGQLDLADNKEKETNKAEAKNEAIDADRVNRPLPKVKGAGNGTFTYLVADDLYPNQPNVRFRPIEFEASAFARGWNLHQVGPFVIAVRQR